MDIDAQGNAEKAAWKRYAGYAMLALAKGVAKKNMAAAVFGKDAKSSKNFDNMWSLAEWARNNPLFLGNRSWDDVRAMSIDEALDTVLLMLNAYMCVIGVAGKNAYYPIAGMSLEEIAAKKANDEAEAAEAEAETMAKQEADKAKEAEEEAQAKQKADAKPERTAAEAAIGALVDASRDDMMQVMAHLVTRLSVEDLAMMRDQLAVMVANAEAAAPATSEDQAAAAGYPLPHDPEPRPSPQPLVSYGLRIAT